MYKFLDSFVSQVFIRKLLFMIALYFQILSLNALVFLCKFASIVMWILYKMLLEVHLDQTKFLHAFRLTVYRYTNISVF